MGIRRSCDAEVGWGSVACARHVRECDWLRKRVVESIVCRYNEQCISQARGTAHMHTHSYSEARKRYILGSTMSYTLPWGV